MTSEPEAGIIRTTVNGRCITRTKRTATALGALAGVAALLLLPACSDGDDSDDTAGVASLGDSSTDSTAASTDSSTAEENYQQAMLDYAQCMREHGIDMPDPQFSEGGAALDVFPGEGEPTAQEQNEIEAADSACNPILEEAEADMPAPSPEEEAEAREWALAFSQCMRDQGVEDYLDPQFDEDGGYMLSTTDAIRSDPDFQDAQTACQDEGSEPGGGPPPSDGAGSVGGDTAAPSPGPVGGGRRDCGHGRRGHGHGRRRVPRRQRGRDDCDNAGDSGGHCEGGAT